jgi:hypothetical protein
VRRKGGRRLDGGQPAAELARTSERAVGEERPVVVASKRGEQAADEASYY